MLLLRLIIVRTMGILFCCLIIIQIVCSSSAADERHQENSSMFNVINEKSNGILQDIWRREPSIACNIPKPSERSLEDETFLEFYFNQYLCVILYDTSLRYIELTTSESNPLNNIQESAKKIIENSPHDNNFCHRMKENEWSTNIEENKRWLQEFNTLMKNISSCNRYCVVNVINPLCAYVLWLDSSIKAGNHIQQQIEHNAFHESLFSGVGNKQLTKQHEQRYEVPKEPTEEKVLKLPAGAQEEQNISNTSKNQRKPTSIQDPEKRLFFKMSLQSPVKTFGHSISVYDNHSDKNESGQKPPGPATNLFHSSQATIKESKGDDSQVHGQVVQLGPSQQDQTINEQLQDALKRPQLPNPAPNRGQLHSEDVDRKIAPEVSTLGNRLSSTDSNVSTSEHSFDKNKGLVSLGVQNKLINPGIAQQDMDKPSHFSIPNETKQLDLSHEEKVENGPKQGDVKAPDIPSKDKPTSPASDGGKIDVSVNKNAESTLSHANKPPEANSELEDANHAGGGLSEGAPAVEPDNHEQQREMEENLGSRDEDVMDHPEEQSPEMVDTATDEPRFREDGDEPIIKPNTSPKIVDYDGLPDEDDARLPINAEQDTIAQNDADAGYVHDRFVDSEDSHFFAYFMTMIILCIIGYLIFHNKQKILALALEGRVRKGNRRRPSTSGYRKLDSNLEEAVTSNCSGTSVTHVIY